MFKTRLILSKSIFPFQALFFSTVLWSHDADTLQTIEKIHEHGNFQLHVQTLWESRYVSEGRDALEGKSISTGSLEIGYDHLSLGVWYGRSSNHEYEERQFSMAISEETDDYEFYLAYGNNFFLREKESEDEWSLGIGYKDLPFGMNTVLDSYYSIDAKGVFLEWMGGKEFNPNEGVVLYLSGTLGWNENYVRDGHDGLNFFAFRNGFSKILSQNFLLFGHGTYNWAINQNKNLAGDLALKNTPHLGFGLKWDF